MGAAKLTIIQTSALLSRMEHADHAALSPGSGGYRCGSPFRLVLIALLLGVVETGTFLSEADTVLSENVGWGLLLAALLPAGSSPAVARRGQT